MNKRQEIIFNLVVQEYIQSAEPIGSRLLMEKSSLGVSSATIRNELASLEEQGYIYQPHTSAGRVPSEKGYRYFIKHLVHIQKPLKSEQKYIGAILGKKNSDEDIKNLAKYIRDITNETIIVAFNADSLYYTGIANLFSKPEFIEREHVYSISQVIDHLEDVMNEAIKDTQMRTVAVGSDSPFGKLTSAVSIPFNNDGSIVILGPLRMDFGRVVGIIDYIQSKL